MEMMDILLAKSMAVGASSKNTEEIVNNHFVAGTNIVIEDNADGTQTISASGEVSSEDTFAREEIANHKADKANPHEVTAAQIGLDNVDNVKQVAGLSSGTTQNNLVKWGANGYTVADAGVAVETSVSDSDSKIPTSKAVYTELSGKQDTIADLADIEAGAAAGATAVQPGDIGTAAKKNVDYFATATQGGKADSAIQGVKVNSGSAITPDANKVVDITVSKSTVDLSNVDNNQQVRALTSAPTENNLVTWGANGYTVKNSGKAVSTTVASTSTDNDIPTAKAVYTEVNKKQNKLTFDDAPTNGSSNPVKSGGIYTALSGKEDTIADLSDIRTGAGKGATAIQSVQVNGTALTPDANKAVDITAVTGVKGNSESTYRTGQVNITKTNVGLGNVDNNKQVRALSTTPTSGDIVTWGANGYTVADGGVKTETTLTTNSDARIPTSKAVSTYVTGLASASNPVMDGTAAPGSSTDYARADHVHPSDTSKQDVLTFNGTYNASTNPAATVATAKVVMDANGGKNKLQTPDISDLSGTLTSNATINSDGSISIVVDSTLSADGGVNYMTTIPAGTYHYSAIEGSSTAETNAYDSYIQKQVGGSWTTIIRDNSTNPGNVATFEAGEYRVTLRLRKSLPAGTYTFKPMLCTTAEYAISPEYQPYSKTNVELTNDESEDRAALVEVVDSGAKNVIQFDEIGSGSVHDPSSYTNHGVTFTINSNGTISCSGQNDNQASSSMRLWLNGSPLSILDKCTGGYVLSGCPSDNPNNKLKVMAYRVAHDSIPEYAATDYGSGILLPSVTNDYINVIIEIGKGVDATGLMFKPMICTKAVWDISQTYQPYRPSYQELYDMVKASQT